MTAGRGTTRAPRYPRRRAAVAPVGLTLVALALAGAAAIGCAAVGRGERAQAAGAPARDGWRPLVVGDSLTAWRGYRADAVPPGWVASGGVLSKRVGTRDLVTRDQYGDFELEWEWKVATGGNAGVFYRATEEYDRVYWSGTEYQLLDDANAPDGRSRLTAAGAVYGLYPAPPGVVRAAGEWNASRIVARGAHVEHWLNGRKLAE